MSDQKREPSRWAMTAATTYRGYGNLDGWAGPIKADVRRQTESDDRRIAAHKRVEEAKAVGHLAAHPSKEVIARVAAILRCATENPPSQLMYWRARLFCGHIIERSSHPEHKTAQLAFSGQPVDCLECGARDQVMVAITPSAPGPIPGPRLPRNLRSRAERPKARERVEDD